MKNLLVALLLLTATASAQTPLPNPAWQGLYIASDTLLKPNGDSIFIFAYQESTMPVFTDTTVLHNYILRKVTITTTGDTLYAQRTETGSYVKSDTLVVNGNAYTGKQVMATHYNSAWRQDEKAISKAVLRKTIGDIGW